MSDPQTIAVYDAKTQEYAELTATDGDLPVLRDFEALLPRGSKVLDYGCGPGHAAAYFARKGHTVHAFDASIEMVKLAKAHDGVTAWQSYFSEFQAVEEYDGIWASFSLLHAARSDIPKLLGVLRAALRPKGWLYIGVKLGSGEARDEIGRLYTYFQEDEISHFIQEAGFTIKDTKFGSGLGLDGTPSKWISIVAHG